MSKKLFTLCFMLALIGLSPCIAAADAQTVYYYNPDGGQYIHADPQCSTINSKYWPIMEPISLEALKNSELRRLCAACCIEKNDAEAFFQGKEEVEGSFDVTEKAAENLKFYTYCYENALSYLIDMIGEREEQYAILVESGEGRWGYPDSDDVSREMAIAIAYAALQEYIGIGEDDLCLYFADPWLDIQTYDEHEWMVSIHRVLHTGRFYNSFGYHIFINAENGLISKISHY